MDTPNAWSVLTSVASMIVVWFDLIKSVLSSIAWPATALTAIFVFKKDVIALLSKLASIKAGGVEAQFAHDLHQLNPLPSATEASTTVVAEAQHQIKDPAAEDKQQGDNDEHDPPDIDAADEPPIEAVDDRKEESDQQWLILFSKILGESGISGEADPKARLRAFASTLGEHLMKNSIDGAAAKDLDEARLIASNSPSGAVLLAWRAIEGILQQVPVPSELSMFTTINFKHRWRNPSAVMRHLLKSSLVDEETYDRFYELQKLRNTAAHATQFTAAPADVLEYIKRAEELAVTLTSVVTRLSLAKQPTPAPPVAP